jgi:hypothetical protein
MRTIWWWVMKTTWWKRLDENDLMRTTWWKRFDENDLMKTTWWRRLDENDLMKTTWWRRFDENDLMRTTWWERLDEDDLMRTTWWWRYVAIKSFYFILSNLRFRTIFRVEFERRTIAKTRFDSSNKNFCSILRLNRIELFDMSEIQLCGQPNCHELSRQIYSKAWKRESRFRLKKKNNTSTNFDEYLE